ncbi:MULTISPECIES: hypothetical protein [unclassified Aeromicrobium]|jgi:hypothetical protein|uniref:hypothetical protein n=1 Tax=unclassified Aeromicrobium TaxID=2633570 RepID=UPI000A9D55E1|nr:MULTISPECIES: hypothetical protein [unclassified Aeromicrobium]
MGKVSEAEVDRAIAHMVGRESPAVAAPAAGATADFRRVGLSEADAAKAASGLERGVYSSFAEAASLTSAFSTTSGALDHELVESVGRARRVSDDVSRHIHEALQGKSAAQAQSLLSRIEAALLGQSPGGEAAVVPAEKRAEVAESFKTLRQLVDGR